MNKTLFAALLFAVSLSTFAAGKADDIAQQLRECTRTCQSVKNQDLAYCAKLDNDSRQRDDCRRDKQQDYEQCSNQCDRKYR